MDLDPNCETKKDWNKPKADANAQGTDQPPAQSAASIAAKPKPPAPAPAPLVKPATAKPKSDSTAKPKTQKKDAKPKNEEELVLEEIASAQPKAEKKPRRRGFQRNQSKQSSWIVI